MNDDDAPGTDDGDAIQYAVGALLGPEGRMVSLSKSNYAERHPQHVVVFNANVLVGGIKRWWGDIDITRQEHLLVELATRTGEPVSVLYERDARFATEAEPVIERAVYSAMPDGETRLGDSQIVRTAGGKLVRRKD